MTKLLGGLIYNIRLYLILLAQSLQSFQTHPSKLCQGLVFLFRAPDYLKTLVLNMTAWTTPFTMDYIDSSFITTITQAIAL